MQNPDALSLARQYVADHFSEAMQDLVHLCSYPSVTTDPEPIEECAAAVASLLKSIGAQTKILRVPGGHPAVHGFVRGRNPKTLLFFNHYDVESPGLLEKWQSPPFSPEVRGDKLFGRGTADNKGSFLTRVWGTRALQASLGTLPFNLEFLVEAKKAIFAPHLAMLLQAHPALFQADACLWENALNSRSGRPTIRLGDKGILAVELVSQANPSDLSSQFAGAIPSATWNLVHALDSLFDSRGRILLDGFYDEVQKPTAQEQRWIQKVPLEYEGILDLWGGDAKQEKRGRNRLFFEPTCNISGLTAGPSIPGEKRMSLVPREARAVLDFRLVPNQDPKPIYRQLCNHLTQRGLTEIQVNHMGSFPAHKSAPTDPIVTALHRASEQTYHVAPAYEPLNSASSVRYLFAERRPIPIVGIGIGYPDSNIGRPNEHIRIDDFHKGIEFVAATLLEYA